MKALFFAAAIFLFLQGPAQYYYKDIVGTRESNELLSLYRTKAVQGVTLKSYTINNTPVDNLSVEQFFSPSARTLLTITKSDYQPPSYLTTFYNEDGNVMKTTDSTAGTVNTTVYLYNSQQQVTAISTVNGDMLAATKTDDHLWQYDGQNRINRMLRIKNKKDTSVISFKTDEAGNVIEEQETRRFIKDEPFYYYYDAKNRLTDIVRYNKKAARLLPEQMFEYSVKDHLIQRTTISQNNSDYLVWRYRFDSNGLKTREDIFNKQKELTGRVEYIYTYNK